MDISSDNKHAWGLELGRHMLRLAHVVSDDGRLTVDRVTESHSESPHGLDTDLTPAVRALAERAALADGSIPADVPLIVSLPDDQVMQRRLTLPRADDADIHRMVESQLEVLLPGRVEMMHWGWARAESASAGDTVSVWLCAARRQVVDQAVRACQALGRAPDRVISRTHALAAGLSRFGETGERPTLVLHVAEDVTSVLVMREDRLAECALVDEGPDTWAERAAGQESQSIVDTRAALQTWLNGESVNGFDDQDIAEWGLQLREASEELRAALPADQRPEGAQLSGITAARLIERAQSALGHDVKRFDVRALPDADRDDVTSLAAGAVGAACAGLDRQVLRVDLQPQRQVDRPRAKVAWYARPPIWLAAGCLVVLVAAMYIADVSEASWRDEQLAMTAARKAARQRLERETAMALLLERNGPPPLAMFDEIIECVPDGIFLYDWSYTIRDRATIAGVANKFEILQTYMERLAEARTLERIELTSWKTVSKKVEFELTATVARWYVPRPPDKVEPTEEADKPEESKKPEEAKEPDKPAEVKKEEPAKTPPPPEPTKADKPPEQPAAAPDEEAAKAAMREAMKARRRAAREAIQKLGYEAVGDGATYPGLITVEPEGESP